MGRFNALAALVGVAVGGAGHAEGPSRQSELLAPLVLRATSVGAGTQFGYSVSISGDAWLIGQPLVPTGLPGTHGDAIPTAYLYRGASSREADLVDTQPTAPPCEVCNERFASAVAVSGDLAVIGHPRRRSNGNDSGAAYVFARGTPWTLQAVLVGADTGTGDLFGSSVAILDGTIVVGAPGNSNAAGAVYVFSSGHGVWQQTQKLTGSHAGAGDSFGAAVGVSYSTVIVGAPLADASDNGAAYIYRNFGAGFVEQQWIPSPRAGAANHFGASVAIDRITAVVGAPGETFGGVPEVGAAYAFGWNGGTWSQLKRFEGTAAIPIRYGAAVAVRGRAIVIGAPPPPDTTATGAATLYTRSGSNWWQFVHFDATDGDGGEEYGKSVSVDGDTVIVGAPGFQFGGDLIGAALVYSISSLPCPGDLDGDGRVGGSDLAQILTQWGPSQSLSIIPADVNHDGVVNSADIGVILGGWGPCP